MSSPEIQISAKKIVIHEQFVDEDDEPYSKIGKENTHEEKHESFHTFQAMSAARPREFGAQITNNLTASREYEKYEMFDIQMNS